MCIRDRLRGPERARLAVSECGSVGESSEEGTGEAARDDRSSAVPQADPATDCGVEPAPEGLEELLRLWVSTPSLPRDQHVCSIPSHAAPETAQPTALPPAGRGQLL